MAWIGAVHVRLATCCVLLLAGFSVQAQPKASPEAPAPTVVHADQWEPPAIPEAEILAARIVRREASGAAPNDAAHRALSREIDAVLSRIRDEHPEVAGVVARETYDRRRGVILALAPELVDTVSRLLGNRNGPVMLRTGHVQFDNLNASLGLRAAEVFPSFGAVAFFFDNAQFMRRSLRLAENLRSAYAPVDVNSQTSQTNAAQFRTTVIQNAI